VPYNVGVHGLFVRSWELIGTVWVTTALGTLLLLVAAGAGCALGRHPSMPLVRVVAWWVRHIVLPLATCRAWWRRAASIFVNNITILAALLGAGRWPVAPLFGVAAIGISLGIALRVISDLPVQLLMRWPSRSGVAKYRIRVGAALNLLEPPAIMLTVGLSLARPVMSLPTHLVWETFGFWVVPATLLAAGGEALWLGAAQAPDAMPGAISGENAGNHRDQE